MFYRTKHFLLPALLLILAGCVSTPGYEALEIRSEILGMQHYTEGVDSREQVTAVEDIVRDAMGSARKSERVAAELTKLLHLPGTTLDAKRAACRQLYLVGGAGNVASIAKLMGHVETADMARYAIERIDAPVVDDQLLFYLDKGPDSAKPGIINSLAARGTEAAVPALEELVDHRNPKIVAAAKSALEKLGT